MEPDKGLEYSINLFFIGGSHFVDYVVFVFRKKKLLSNFGDELLNLAPLRVWEAF